MITITQNQLDQLELVEEDLLTDLPAFPRWHRLTEGIYQKIVANNPKFDYRPYQPRFAAIAALRPSNLLGHLMGVGKTLTSLLLAAALYPNLKEARPGFVHIVTPSQLAATRWLEELALFPEWEGMYEWVASERQLLNSTSPILLYSHDFPKRQARKAPGDHLSCVLSKQLKPALWVIDEIHLCGDRKSVRYRHLKRVRLSARRALGLSGTISDEQIALYDAVCRLTHDPVWGLHFGRPQELQKRYTEVRQIHTHYQKGQLSEGDGEVPSRTMRYIHPDKLAEFYWEMRAWVHRVTLDEPEVSACVRKPKAEIEVVEVQPSAQQLGLYRDYIRTHEQALTNLAGATTATQQAQAISLVYPLVQTAHVGNPDQPPIPKAQAVLDLVGKHKKTAVFVNHVESSRYLYRLFQKQYEGGDSQVVRLYAQDDQATPRSLSGDQRAEIVDRFRHDPNVKAGVFSLNLANFAIDLTEADAVIFYCLGWDSLKVLQGISRVVRPGNPAPIVPIYFVSNSGMIDQHQLLLCKSKLEAAHQMHDYSEVEPTASSRLNVGEVLRAILTTSY